MEPPVAESVVYARALEALVAALFAGPLTLLRRLGAALGHASQPRQKAAER